MATENKISTAIDRNVANSLKPKLRFKEFEGNWEERKLVSEINFIAGYAFKSFEMKNIDSKYQLIKMSNVYKSELQLNRNPSYWGEIDSKIEKYLLKKKDILLTLTGTVGKQDYGYSIVIPINNRFLLNQRLVCLRAKPNRSDSDFINNLIKTTRFYYFFFGESKGGTGNQTNVGIDDLRNIKLNFPKLPEQQKIATFLTAVDTKLQQLNSKKSALETYKKGTMQQLFSQKIRFKTDDGSDFADWEEKKLGALMREKITNGETVDKSKYLSDGNSYLIQLDDLFKSSTVLNIDKLSRVNLKKSAKKIKINDVIINRVSIKPSGVAKVSIISNISKRLSTSFESNMFRVRFKLESIDSLFFSYFSLSVSYVKQKLALAKVTNQASLSQGDICFIKMSVPDITEQQKIANYLSAIDVKIESVQQQVKKTQAFKKGLLQQMFV